MIHDRVNTSITPSSDICKSRGYLQVVGSRIGTEIISQVGGKVEEETEVREGEQNENFEDVW